MYSKVVTNTNLLTVSLFQVQTKRDIKSYLQVLLPTSTMVVSVEIVTAVDITMLEWGPHRLR
jgi:hypothetical protein